MAIQEVLLCSSQPQIPSTDSDLERLLSLYAVLGYRVDLQTKSSYIPFLLKVLVLMSHCISIYLLVTESKVHLFISVLFNLTFEHHNGKYNLACSGCMS